MTSGLRTCISSLLVACSLPLLGQSIQIHQTTSDLSSTLQELPGLSFSPSLAPLPLDIRVDDTQRFQTMDGFGASITEGTAWLLETQLSEQARHKVMTQLFDPVHGVGLSFLRQPIGSSDLSRTHTSFDDMPAGQSDPKLEHFSTAMDDTYVFPLIREALHLNPSITVMATPWSPPAWMKTKDSMNGGSLREDRMAAYADYLTRSIKAFQQAGVPVQYLSVQNEPLNETRDYPGTLMLASQARRLIGQYLGPDLRSSGLTTQVLAYDHNWDHPEYPLEVLSDPLAAPFVAGSALHCYGGSPEAQDQIHDRFPDKGIWMTECSGGTWQKESPLLATARLMIESTRHWAKSVVLWGIALDTEHNPHAGGCGTCRGLVTLDLHQSPPAVTYTGDFYALAQATSFVHPGATRIASTSLGRMSLQTVAFQNRDGILALLVLNNLATATTFSITWHGTTTHTQLQPGAFATYTWSPKP